MCHPLYLPVSAGCAAQCDLQALVEASGITIALGIYFGLKAISSEVSLLGPVNATVTLETIRPIEVEIAH